MRGRGNSAAPAARWRKAAGRLCFRWRRRPTTTRDLCCCSPAGSCSALRSPATTCRPGGCGPCVCELRPRGHERQRRCGAGAEGRGWASCAQLARLSPIPGPGHVWCGRGGGPEGQALRVPREEGVTGCARATMEGHYPAHLLFHGRTWRLQEEEA